jgi:pyruvate formate lyase activating enzyme
MINIGGFEKSTLLDYPGKVSAVIFTHGCNLRCPYCHNPELVIEPFAKKSSFSEEYILRFLSKRVGKLDGVVVTGGEPLIQKGILEFIHKIKEMGFLIKLDSNGMLPRKLKEAIETGDIDCVAMDVKYSKEGYKTFSGIQNVNRRIQESIDMILDSGLDYEFRTTYVKGIHTEESVGEISKMIEGSKEYFIQNFRSGKTIDMELSPQNSFTEIELKKFKEIALQYIPKVVIRN